MKLKKWILVMGGLLGSVALGVSLTFFPPSFLRVKEVVLLNQPKHVSEFDLIRLSGIKKEISLLTLRLSRVRKQILRFPWIREVELSKRFPGRLLIEVQEQISVALLELESLYLVNAEGVVFKKLEAGDPKDLPILTGLKTEDLRTQLVPLIALLQHFDQSESIRTLGISEIHRSAQGEISIFTKEPCIRVELGDAEWMDRLDRLALAWKVIQATAAHIKVVDLSFEKRIIVKQGNSQTKFEKIKQEVTKDG